MAMLKWITMDIIHMATAILCSPNKMLPIITQPNTPFAMSQPGLTT